MSPMLTTETAREVGRIGGQRIAARAELKRRLKAGEVQVFEVITSPPPELHSTPVYKLLPHLPGVRRTRVERIIESANLAAGRPIDGLPLAALSPRERRLLVGAYVRHCPAIARSAA